MNLDFGEKFFLVSRAGPENWDVTQCVYLGEGHKNALFAKDSVAKTRTICELGEHEHWFRTWEEAWNFIEEWHQDRRALHARLAGMASQRAVDGP